MKTILLLVLLTLASAPAYADERRRSDERRGFPFSSEEHWDGYRTWKPDRDVRRRLPDRFTVDRPGNCEVRCTRVGNQYQCREYRC
jgi:Ni/Co efflux regulator RcnB